MSEPNDTGYTPDEQGLATIHSDYVDGYITEEEYLEALAPYQEEDE